MAGILPHAQQGTPPAAQSEAGLAPLCVAYYRRMKPGKVYPVEVAWPQQGTTPTDSSKVTVRLLAAGAQVVPSEHTLDSSGRPGKVTFFVTPLAQGWLRAQRVEVVHQGRKIQEIPLSSKVVTQKATWLLLLLTVLLPWFILTQLKSMPMNSVKEYIGLDNKTETKTIPLRASTANDIRENVPEMPGLVQEKLPAVADRLRDVPTVLAEAYADLVLLSKNHPLAFYVGVVMLTLTLISAWLHRQKSKRRWSNRLAVGP